MNQRKLLTASAAAMAASAMLIITPAGGALAADGAGSDYAFNEMILEMAGQDTGSQWFNYYVERVNQEIAFKEGEQPYGAAGPSGPLAGFDGYLAGFSDPDTGSKWFNAYVDSVKRTLRAQEK